MAKLLALFLLAIVAASAVAQVEYNDIISEEVDAVGYKNVAATEAGGETTAVTSSETASSSETSTDTGSSATTSSDTVSPTVGPKTPSTKCGSAQSGVTCRYGVLSNGVNGKARKCKAGVTCSEAYCCRTTYAASVPCSSVVQCPAGYRRKNKSKNSAILRCKDRADSTQKCSTKRCCRKPKRVA